MKRLTILDGGMGRELQDIGAPFSQPLWSAQALIESPEYVRKAHQNFIDAGSEIIIVNSYACVPFHLGEERYKTDGAKLARQAAIIAESVALNNNSVRVAGAIPPPFGSYRPDLFYADEAKKIITTLIKAQEPHVDLWIAETISSLQELEVIHSVLKNSTKDSYYSFSLNDSGRNEAKLRSGQPVKMATAIVCLAGAKGIFFNCSVPEVMEQAIKDAKEVIEQYGTDVEIGVYANNFMPIKTDHEANDTLQSMRKLSPEDYLVYAKRWYELGASTIGGCCGISPSHIKALAEWKKH
ncbi:homocysteine S-methyltransferase family protein [Photobacterium profundum]|uniref:Homocysteine S-methyltransferase family protein n=1 Tax=Photobacterium profundum 3TCK TaxID=314280 RepID=Q1Z9M7_9GAMM|nr:homocysteine S-methyltransferase family protein [Photobacterium profundum]EAS45815.1 homocysteine S-methyltransferase family protein [Photobacterium profundum 3TCK]PSV63058.1 homocysteine S-methyltransferase family protein [Photobacterium profundum]